ncbi:MAG: hypothetical protein IPK22_00165 [Verrucomicrobiaceae bacterium]|nr:hypothetical protein [Verrucomicrobiaceae bacterium]
MAFRRWRSTNFGLVELAKNCPWPKVTRWIARNLATQPEALNALLVGNKSNEVLEGMNDAFKGLRKAPKPANWDLFVVRALARAWKDQERAKARTTNLSILFGDGRALDDVKKIAFDDKADITTRESALKTLIEARPDDLRDLCEQLLDTRHLNLTAVRGLALFDDPDIGQKLAKNYRKFAPTVMDTLVARPAFAKALLAEMAAGRIPRTELSAFHARQIRASMTRRFPSSLPKPGVSCGNPPRTKNNSSRN